MRSASKINILFLAILASMASAHAQSQREQLNQMVDKLQRSPTDSALREKIIKLAQSIKPAPAIPDNAIRFEGRAQFAFKSAKSEDDFLAAAREYEKAVAVAPWVQGYYADLCTIYEKAGKLEEAKRHCESHLVGLTDVAQMTDVKRRIAGLEFGIEKALAAPRAQSLGRLQGTWAQTDGDFVFYYRLRVEGDEIRFFADRYVYPSQGSVSVAPGFYGEYRLKSGNGEYTGVYVEGTQKKACVGREAPARAVLSSDGLGLNVVVAGSFSSSEMNSCRYSPGSEVRFVMRKQA